MSRGAAMGPFLLLPILLIASIASIYFFFLPLNPTIIVTFTVSDSAGTITVNTNPNATFYAKSTIVGSAGIPQGQILLSQLGAVNGTNSISIEVRYGSEILTSPQSFPSIGNGNYQMKVVYGTRPESTTTPYTIILTLLSPSLFIRDTKTVTLFPS